MKIERLSKDNKELFDQAFRLYENSFPEEERRDRAETERVLMKDEYHFCMLTEKDSLVGIMLYWLVRDILYLEHFAIVPGLRNQGYGTAALDLLKAKGKTVILEIEPPTDDLKIRRYEFYKRNGFVMNSHYHIQAKYHLGDEDLELKILSYPNEISRADYLSFYDFMSREIGLVPNIANGIVVRDMLPDDDAVRVAELIYYTDAYIYPYWFDCFEDAVKVITQMIELPTLYNRKNITVSVAENGEIAGIVVSIDSPFAEQKEFIYRAFELAGVKRDGRTDEMFEAYYANMGQEQNILYISNVVVHENYRKRGIAAAMIQHVLKEHPVAFLECVQKNAGSWRLYQRLGFEIECEYAGVFDVPCFKMKTRKEAD